MCASLDLSKTQNLSSFPQGSNTYVVKYVIIAFAWEYGFHCTSSMLSDRYLGRFECHTGHCIFKNWSYNNCVHCNQIYLTNACSLYNRYNIIHSFGSLFFTIQSTCLFQVKSLDKVTPSNFAYSTVSTRLPSMAMLGIKFLTLSSGLKQKTISFDFLS